jgi:hypothetical protein
MSCVFKLSLSDTLNLREGAACNPAPCFTTFNYLATFYLYTASPYMKTPILATFSIYPSGNETNETEDGKLTQNLVRDLDPVDQMVTPKPRSLPELRNIHASSQVITPLRDLHYLVYLTPSNLLGPLELAYLLTIPKCLQELTSET